MTLYRSISRTLPWNLGGQFVNLVYPFILFLLLAQAVETNQFERFVLFVAFGNALYVVVDAGTQVYLVPHARYEYERTGRTGETRRFAIRKKLLTFVLLSVPVFMFLTIIFEATTAEALFVVSGYGMASVLSMPFISHATGKAFEVTQASFAARAVGLLGVCVLAAVECTNTAAYLFFSSLAVFMGAALLACIQRGGETKKQAGQLTSIMPPREGIIRASENLVVTLYANALIPVTAAILGPQGLATFLIAERIVRSFQGMMYAYFLSLHPNSSDKRLGVKIVLKQSRIHLVTTVSAWMLLPLSGFLIGDRIGAIYKVDDLSLWIIVLSPLALLGTIGGFLVYSVIAPRLDRLVPLKILLLGAAASTTALVFFAELPTNVRLALALGSADAVIIVSALIFLIRVLIK